MYIYFWSTVMELVMSTYLWSRVMELVMITYFSCMVIELVMYTYLCIYIFLVNCDGVSYEYILGSRMMELVM